MGASVAAPRGRRPALAGAVLALALLGSLAYLAVDVCFAYVLAYAWFGIGYGLLLQYGRFCMASAVRDLFAVGVPRMAVGVLIASSLFAVTAALAGAAGLSGFEAHPLGWHVLAGGAVFGVGMVLAGGCASSSLYKTGEGHLSSVLVLLAIAFSQAWFVSAGGWLDELAPAAWSASALDAGLPDALNATAGWFDLFTIGYLWERQGFTALQWLQWPATLWSHLVANALLVAVLPSLLLLMLLYGLNYRKVYLRRQAHGIAGWRGEVRGLWSMLRESRNTALAGLGLGLLAGLQLWLTALMRRHHGIYNFGELLDAMGHTRGLSLQGTVFDPGYWYITTQEAQWGGWVLEKLGAGMRDNVFFGLDNGLPQPLLNAPGMMSVGIILGACLLACLRGEFKLRRPSLETAVLAIAGGVLMGIGARIGMGCNIGAFFATVTNGDPGGWLFLLGMTAGGFLAVRALKYWINWRAARAGFDF